MFISENEAYELLRRVGESVRAASETLDGLQAARRDLVQMFDGQPGMNRTRMADAIGVNRHRLHAIVKGDSPLHEFLADDAVELPQDLYEALRDVLDEAARSARSSGIELDVAPRLWA